MNVSKEELIDNIQKKLNTIENVPKYMKISMMPSLFESSYKFIQSEHCTDNFRSTFVGKLLELKEEKELTELCERYLGYLNIQEDHIHSFTRFDSSDTRCMYKLKLNTGTYIAKLTYIDESDEKTIECHENCVHSSEMEIMVYEKLKGETNVPEIVFSQKKVSKKASNIYFSINNQNCKINFTEFKDTYCDKAKYFSVLVTKEMTGYGSLYSFFRTTSFEISFAEEIFKKALKIQYGYNQKYKMTHGDFLTTNIFINNKSELMIFDFDISTIDNKISNRRVFFDNYEPGYATCPQIGFLFDFYRFYISFYLFGNLKIFKNNQLIKDLTKLIEKYKLMYNIFYKNRDGMYNDLMPFAEWVTTSPYNKVMELLNIPNSKKYHISLPKI